MDGISRRAGQRAVGREIDSVNDSSMVSRQTCVVVGEFSHKSRRMRAIRTVEFEWRSGKGYDRGVLRSGNDSKGSDRSHRNRPVPGKYQCHPATARRDTTHVMALVWPETSPIDEPVDSE